MLGEDSAGLEGHLDSGILEDPRDLDIGPARLLVLLHDDPLVGRLLGHGRGHLAAVGGLQVCNCSSCYLVDRLREYQVDSRYCKWVQGW